MNTDKLITDGILKAGTMVVFESRCYRLESDCKATLQIDGSTAFLTIAIGQKTENRTL